VDCFVASLPAMTGKQTGTAPLRAFAAALS